THGVCFVHDANSRMPNLFERVAHNPLAGVSQTRIFPAQYNGHLCREILLGAIDVTDVRHPSADRVLSRAGMRVWALFKLLESATQMATGILVGPESAFGRSIRAGASELWDNSTEVTKRPANNRNLLSRPSGLRPFVSAIFTNVVSSVFLYLLGPICSFLARSCWKRGSFRS